jgi:UPF0042 nucleotide-binding protein
MLGKIKRETGRVRHEEKPPEKRTTELVIITGMSGSGKASALKAFEDLGYYCSDHLPVDLTPQFAKLVLESKEIERGALVIDVREGNALEKFPKILKEVRKLLPVRVVYSETRRPHPLGTDSPVRSSLKAERKWLAPIRKLADIVIDTSKFNVHELRAHVLEQFTKKTTGKGILVSVVSFGFKLGVPEDSDLVFDVRFLPNPHFVPEFKALTGRHPKVAAYIRSFPQTLEFLRRISEMMIYLMPHYVREGKSYLTIAIGCTGGQHRSVMMSEELGKSLRKAGYRVKVSHRDMPK